MREDELQVFGLLEFRPEQGVIFCCNERMLLISASIWGALQKQLLSSLGPEETKRVIKRFGYRCGFQHQLSIENILGTSRTGGVAGRRLPQLLGFLKMENVNSCECDDPPSFRIQLNYRNSVEAEQYRLHSGLSPFPVCWWNIAYAAGYCSASFGLEIYFREAECAAQGHELCQLIGQDISLWTPEEIEHFREEYGFSDAEAVGNLWSELRAEHVEQSKQRAELLRLPTRRSLAPSLPRRRAAECAEAAGFVVREEVMLDALEQAVSVAMIDIPVLVEGETGSGKEFVVSLIHSQSARAQHSLISINCAALTETLLETELFGHVRGAFTGAVCDKPGLFELANEGTLFLDEIGEMPLTLQAKLLRVLEDGKVRRIGSTTSTTTNVRVLAATNRNLRAMARSGEFRSDLYFRLNSFVIQLPPLRERRESIPALVQTFLAEFGRRSCKQLHSITPEVMRLLLDYQWPGNVRELKHAVERAALVATDGVIRIEDLPAEITELPRRAAVESDCINLDEGERQVIEHALVMHNGNRMSTATALNVSVTTLWRKMRRYGLL